MSRRRRNISAVLVAVAALVYGISPIDVIPELLTGPLGLTDDLAVLLGAGFAVYKLLTGRGDPRTGGATPPPAR
ncbi:DUF1232 domain-containing protein [Glaciihabitans sp. dw_435]|uniref:DUF1232 domain-containing protein n=1 Tax=Glaciihabitans sp. dw_435 TaxID=2720081 RepID=UPI001BD4455E|nr:YkvA family protein [Glaciihabitans sp. dw_435]